MFFESHFTELKYGISPNSTNLEWCISSQPQWGVQFQPGVWFNFAYDIDVSFSKFTKESIMSDNSISLQFTAKTVGLWASQGASPLVKVAANRAASTSTNSEDFHVGVLRIVNSAVAEDWYVSGVFIESGPITTAIGTGSVAPPPPPTPPITSTPLSTISPPPSTSITSTHPSPPPTTTGTPTQPAGPAQTQYGQCGGT